MKREYLPNAWRTFGKTYHVSQQHPQASDEHPGTAALPFKTISVAARIAEGYDRVVIDAGVYREQVPIVQAGHRYYPKSWLIFEAAPGAEVYIKGSDVFNPDWQEIGAGVYEAELPEHLFEEGAYNPYELACERTSSPSNYQYDRAGYDPRESSGTAEAIRKVRPTQGPLLPETLGQVYVDGTPLEQLDSLHAVQDTPGSFVVSADGKNIICHFTDGKKPEENLVELTVRERCFKAQFPAHWGGLMIQTLGIRAEHAAEPGAFSLCRPLSIRRNCRSGITVRRTFHAPNSTGSSYVLRSIPSYLSKDKPTILCSIADSTKPLPPHKIPAIATASHDGLKTWEKVESGPLAQQVANYFLDEENGMLLRYYQRQLTEDDSEGAYGSTRYQLLMEVSPDGGGTWNSPEELEFGERVNYYRIIRLRNGKLFWMTNDNRPELSPLFAIKRDCLFFTAGAWLGQWRPDLSGVDWELAGELKVNPDRSVQGLDEPSACQLPDGRIFTIFRQGCVLPSQEQPGYPCVKLFTVSADDGRTWTEPRPLTFDDGKFAYSSTSYSETICSSRNGRVYVILNILNRPNRGCLPRAVLHVAEIDQDTLCIKRDTVTVIEELLEDHSHQVGYSNWGMLQDRYTENLLLFMKLENGPVYDGYDYNSYRYEIELPE